MFIPLFNEYLRNLDKYWFETNAYRLQLPVDAILVDKLFLNRYPQLLSSEVQQPPVDVFPPVIAGTPDNRQGRYANRPRKEPSSQAAVSKPRKQPRLPIQEPAPSAQPQQLRRRSPRLK